MSDHLNDVSELSKRYFNREYIPDNNIGILIDRVSTKEQARKSSPIVQKRGGNEYTKKNNLHVLETYSIAETAYRHENRKVFNEIVNKIKKSHKTLEKIMHLILSHASRASRNKKSTNLLRSLVLDYGVVLHYYRDNLVLHKASEQAVWDRWEKLHANSEEDNDERRTSSLNGMLMKYEKGIPQRTPPYGYRIIKITKKDSGYAFNPPYSSYMERAFNLVVTGNPNFKKTLDAEFKGIIDHKKILSRRRLIHSLRDPFYHGDFKVKGVFLRGNRKFLPPLISESLWRKVQSILDGCARNTRSKKMNLGFTGTIKCGGEILDDNGNPTGKTCGGSISGEVKRGKNLTWGCGSTRKNCSQRNATYMRSIGSQRYFSDEKIQEMLLAVIKEIKLTEGMLEWFKKKVESTVFEASDFKKDKIARIQSNITKKENVRKRLTYAHAIGTISASDYREFDQNLVDEIRALKSLLKKLEDVQTENDWIQDAIMKKISNLEETFKTSPDYIKNKMILSFCNHVELKVGKLIPDYKSFMKR